MSQEDLPQTSASSVLGAKLTLAEPSLASVCLAFAACLLTHLSTPGPPEDLALFAASAAAAAADAAEPQCLLEVPSWKPPVRAEARLFVAAFGSPMAS